MNIKPRRDLAAQPPLQPMDSSGVPAPRTPCTAVSTPRPESVPMARYKQDMLYLRRQIAAERARHASVEAVLTRYVASLESQVNDLRDLYIRSLGITVSQHE